MKRAKTLLAASFAVLAACALAALVECAPAAPVQSPPAPRSADALATRDGGRDGAATTGDNAAAAFGENAPTESASSLALPPLPPLPPRVAVQPLVADEVPTAFCPLGATASSPAGPATPPKGKGSHKREKRDKRDKRDKNERPDHEPRPFHAAPRIMIDVAGAADTPVLADLQRTARAKGYWPVRHCYESGLRRDQHLRGSVAIALSVDPSGAVTAASAAANSPEKGSSLADPVAAACIVREVALLSFDGAPGGGARAAADASAVAVAQATQAHIEVTLGTGDVPVFAAAPVPNAEAVRQALRQAWPDATQCFVRALETNPRAGGRMDLHFRIAADGRVSSVQEGEAHLASPDLASCVLDVYRRATLPVTPRGAVETSLVYGLELEPGEAN